MIGVLIRQNGRFRAGYRDEKGQLHYAALARKVRMCDGVAASIKTVAEFEQIVNDEQPWANDYFIPMMEEEGNVIDAEVKH